MQNSIQKNKYTLQSRQVLSRLDKLSFSKWHVFMVFSLGLVWIFDGYEVSLISLFRKYIVAEHNQQVFKALATSYQIGCIFGSAIFGISAYIIGRRKIFLVTLLIYSCGIFLSIIPNSVQSFLVGRFLTGISVGGQFTAIFTAIDQFLPPKYRGRVNIGIDGTWHLGGSIAAILNIFIGQTSAWRYLFTIGLFGVFSLVFMRRNIPQSPRWLILKGNISRADLIVKSIQYTVENKNFYLQTQKNALNQQNNNNQLVSQRSQIDQNIQSRKTQNIQQNKNKSFVQILRQIGDLVCSTLKLYKSRFFLAFFLMFTQAFFFNLIYYKYPATLQKQFNLEQSQIAMYMLPLSLSSFFSTLIIGPLFDKIGRKYLLLITYGASGIILICSSYVQNLFWFSGLICFMFFFTSPAGSSANLIASEIFPTSSRTIVLFIMFIVGMFGGVAGVWVDTVWIGSIFMILAGILGFFLCPPSENKSLQQIQSL